MELRGLRATVMGLGRHGGGVAAARWLADQGAIVTVTDLADATALSDSIAALADIDIAAWRLGQHDERDFEAADLVVVNPAVRPSNTLVARAAARGACITSELELFLQRLPGQDHRGDRLEWRKSTTRGHDRRDLASRRPLDVSGGQYRSQPARRPRHDEPRFVRRARDK